MNYCYEPKEMEKLLKSMVILIDSREKCNLNITDYLDKHNICYKSQKLEFADYSFMLPADVELGIMRNISFENSIVIERKATLEELSNNLTHKRTEFENELLRASKCKFLLLIENGTYNDILLHKYDTQYEPKSFIATLKTFESRYGINTNFINSNCSGNFIYHTFYYYLREFLKGGNKL